MSMICPSRMLRNKLFSHPATSDRPLKSPGSPANMHDPRVTVYIGWCPSFHFACSIIENTPAEIHAQFRTA